MTDNHSQFDHDRYEELCALATAGALTTEESAALLTHLNQCAECNKVFAQYQSLANEGMSMLTDLHRSTPEVAQFDETSALARLLDTAKHSPPNTKSKHLSPFPFVPSIVWRGVAAASILGCIGFGSYHLGERRHRDAAIVPTFLPVQTSNVDSDTQKVKLALQASQRHEAELQSLVSTSSAQIEKLRADAKAAQARLDNLTASLTASKTDAASQIVSLTEQRDAANARLRDAQQSYQTVQDELNNLRSQRKQDLVRIASLESQVGGLTVAVNDQDKRTKNDEQYLASDKDIRDLIGARNLYIADIMDVNETGQARKPFGRVFYTKTKSLIFYAYDLDRQPGVKQTSTFHVWGRTSANDRQPINLGLLYLDSETNRRWTLRVDNPEQLARLDAVFVTIEPGKQIEKPSGKPFLYASLRREPNHP
ncbi:hypothetical protein FTO74_07115 [Granulicella sp. WH15]|uniref:hypothetical protein n=1 Tax=Granulicella sp. WH15 TaxID=2602070 RepID=UPI001366B2BE|nr:hypothetical protein [Granulicella sp. WH15]QHN03165.1 hypothetical protein FTO74_07115 [Granulicella sp. WH15]